MTDSRVILVTGANQGIGYEIVNQLAEKGHIVYLGSRDETRGIEAVKKLGHKNVHFVQLDVTDQTSVNNAVKKIETEQKHLDVLVNNAGITSKGNENGTTVDVEAAKIVYETNFFGVLRVTTAFVPLLKLSSNPIVLNVSSGLGSITSQNDPKSPFASVQLSAYNSSKSALNAYTVVLAHDFKEAKVNCISPGYVATNLNSYRGHLTTQESAAGVIRVGILLDKNGPTGKFLDYTGSMEWPW